MWLCGQRRVQARPGGRARSLAARAAAVCLALLPAPAGVPARAGEPAAGGAPAVVRMTGGEHYAPFHYVDGSGRPAGFDVDLARAVGRRLGVGVEIELGPWERMRERFTAGEFDVLVGLAESSDREREYLFSTPYLAQHSRLFAPAGRGIARAEDMAGLRIAVQRRSVAEDWFRARVDRGRPILVDSGAEALRRVADGRADGCVLTEFRGLYLVRQLGLRGVAPAGPPLFPTSYGFAAPRGRADLVQRLNAGLTLVKQSGEYDRIYERWFGILTPRAPTLREVLRPAAWVAAPLLLLAGLSLGWNRALQREVRRRTEALRASEADLRRARDEAEAASHAKTLFLATMSHEIRTPMNGVVGAAELLRAGERDPVRLETLDTLRTSCDALLVILSDVLDLSKIEAGRLEVERVAFDVREVVRGAARLFAAAAAARGVALRCELDDALPRALLGDPARIRQVLLNLLGNAVKFTERGGIVVRARVVRAAAPGAVEIEVEDSGIGIPEGARTRLFEPFTQADASTTRRFGGTGLGLAISRRLVELMGGRIEVTSAPGAGSLFRFTLPLVEPDPAADAPREDDAPPPALAAAPSAASFAGLRVLVVEDHPVNRRMAARLLGLLGVLADLAEDGSEAIEACARAPYDLVLMDCCMPGVDGFEATRAIRAAETGGRHVTIVALTANAVAGDRERCLATGMDDYLSKPVRLEDLRAVLARVPAPAAVS